MDLRGIERSKLQKEIEKLKSDLKTAETTALLQEKKIQELEGRVRSIEKEKAKEILQLEEQIIEHTKTNAELHLQIKDLEKVGDETTATQRNVEKDLVLSHGQYERLEKEASGHIKHMHSHKQATLKVTEGPEEAKGEAYKNQIEKLERSMSRLQRAHQDEVDHLKNELVRLSRFLDHLMNKTEFLKMDETNPEWTGEAANAMKLLVEGDKFNAEAKFCAAAENYRQGLDLLFKANEAERDVFIQENIENQLEIYIEKARIALKAVESEKPEDQGAQEEDKVPEEAPGKENEIKDAHGAQDKEPEEAPGKENVIKVAHYVIAVGSKGFSYEQIFSPYLDPKVTEITLQETYLYHSYQILNFLYVVEVFYMNCINLKRISLITILNIEETKKCIQMEMLSMIGSALEEKGIQLSLTFNPNIHDRYVLINDTIRIIIGRGIQIYKNPHSPIFLGKYHTGLRECIETYVTVLRKTEKEIKTEKKK